MDYSKWDRLAKEISDEEEQVRLHERSKRKERYNAEQKEKQDQWQLDHPGEQPPKSCCGFARPEDLANSKQKKNSSATLSIEDLNSKKQEAVRATREDGNRLFKEGQYETAYQVYERGVLIINGIHGMPENDFDEMMDIEVILNANMAAVRLAQKNYRDAVRACKITLSLDEDCVKAHFRMGRALLGLGELDKALESFLMAKSLAPNDKAIANQIVISERAIKQQNKKDRMSLNEFASNLQNN